MVRTRDASVEAARPTARPPGNAADDVMQLRQALRELHPEERLLLCMLYLDGYTVTEIAQACGVPPGTVKSRLFHARARLLAALGGAE